MSSVCFPFRLAQQEKPGIHRCRAFPDSLPQALRALGQPLPQQPDAGTSTVVARAVPSAPYDQGDTGKYKHAV